MTTIFKKIELDVLDPPASLWENIEANLPAQEKEPRRIMFTTRKLAIAVLAIVAFSGALGFFIARTSEPPPVAFELPMEYQESEFFFAKQVNLKEKQLRKIEGHEEVWTTLEELDNEFNTLQEELKPGVTNEFVLQAMLQNYRTKLEILERVLESIEQSNPTSHEKTSI